jgi:hypothetical protein
MMEWAGRPLSSEEIGIRHKPLSVVAAKRWIAQVLVADHIRDCAAFLGHKNDRDDFVPHGTAFFVTMQAYGRNFPYIVTAKHVLDKIPDDIVLLRVNATSSRSARYVQLPKESWHFHPKHNEEPGPNEKYIDVAVCKLNFDYTDIDLTFFSTDDFMTDDVQREFDIGTGDDVAITGLFFSHYGETRNVPIVRIGNIAAMPGESLPTDHGLMDGYLVETRSIGGISGSPVFTLLGVRPEYTFLPDQPHPHLERKVLKKAERMHYLLGLVHGYYTINTQEEWVSKTDQQVGDLNTGISIVVPVSKIVETIQQEAVMGIDIKLAAELDGTSKRNSGAKTASAASSSGSIPTTEAEANPSHREDFNRLVSAASKPRPKDDRT